MKRFARPAIFTSVLLAGLSLAPLSHAKEKHGDDTVVDGDAVSTLDAAEEARKIRELMKLALGPKATDTNREVLSAEIALVEKNKKLKENVVQDLLRDDTADPTLPQVKLVHYSDGSVRGLLFIQTDDVHNNKPNEIAWPFDAKREAKAETGRQ